MKFSLSTPYTLEYRTAKSRLSRTVKLADRFDVEIPEISRFDEDDAFRARFVPYDRYQKERERHLNREKKHIALLNNDMHLRGFDGRLWADCASDSRTQTPDLLADVLRIGEERYYGSDYPNRIIQNHVSKNGRAHPAGGFLHWLDTNEDNNRRKRFLILRSDGEATVEGAEYARPDNIAEIIDDQRDRVRQEVTDYAQKNFVVQDGRLFAATPPPVWMVGAEPNCVYRGALRAAKPMPGRVLFRIDDKAGFEGIIPHISAAKHYTPFYEDVEIFAADRSYLAIDQVHFAIEGLKGKLTLAATGFSDLPDETLHLWKEFRRAINAWDPLDADPAKIHELGKSFIDAVPKTNNVKTALGPDFKAFCALMPMLDLRPRIKPEDDPELANLTL